VLLGKSPVKLIAFIVMVFIGLAPARAAFAHASLIASEPAEGTVLPAPPERLVLVFNEPISPLRLQLIDPQGQATVLANVVQHDATLTAAVPRTLGEGTHLLSWRVVSADGHPVGGTVVFSVGHADAAPPATVEATPDFSLRASIWIARLALYVALFVGVGGAVFANWIATTRPLPGAGEKIIIALLWLGLAALPFSVGLQGLDALNVPLSALPGAAVWKAGWDTSYGTTAIVMLIALLAALLAMTARHAAAARLLSLAGLFGIGCALAASGHAAAASPQMLMRPAVLLHVIAVAFWIGSLWPLLAILRDAGAPAREALRRFSRVAPSAIVVLLLSGGVLAVVQLARIDALWKTAYGFVFLAKMAAVVVLLGLAAANRFVLTPRIEAGDPGAGARLRHTAAVELGIALVIFAIVALWRFTPPPRALAATVSAPEFIHFHGEAAMANMILDPGHVGRSKAEIAVSDPNDEPISPKGVALVFSQPAAGIEPIRREAVDAGNNTWRVDDLLIPAPGRWHLRIEILVGDFEKITLEDDVYINR
jgi:copper transport protein